MPRSNERQPPVRPEALSASTGNAAGERKAPYRMQFADGNVSGMAAWSLLVTGYFADCARHACNEECAHRDSLSHSCHFVKTHILPSSPSSSISRFCAHALLPTEWTSSTPTTASSSSARRSSCTREVWQQCSRQLRPPPATEL
eukprot:351955-Chlamydomonas_euryale.AAC.19